MADDTRYAAAEHAARLSGDAAALAHALRHRSDLARLNGQPEIALAQALEAANIYRDLGPGHTLHLANALRLIALATEECHAALAARFYWREALALYHSLGVEAGVAECAAHLGR